MTLRPRPGLSSRIVDGERVVLDREKCVIHQLNSTASIIWDRLEAGREASEIAEELAERFDVNAARALSDVRRVVEELRSLDLLAPQPDGA